MKAMKELKKKLQVLHELHGELSSFVVPARAWMLVVISRKHGLSPCPYIFFDKLRFPLNLSMDVLIWNQKCFYVY